MGRKVVSGQEAETLLKLLWKIEDGYAPSAEEENYLEEIEEVDFTDQSIDWIPNSIGKLKKLKRMYWNNIWIREFPLGLGNLKKLQLLSFRDTQITELPENIGDLKNLETLDFRDTQIAELPESVGNLKSLEYLDLGGTQITELPERLGECKNLQELYLSGTQITKLPERLGECKNLQSLYLTFTQITELPEWLGECKDLQILNLSSTQITKLPERLGECKNLQELYLSGTKITELPESLGECKNLQILNLSSTQLTKLPEWLGACQNLQSLDLDGMQITELPEWLGACENLKRLDLAYCNLDSLPRWITRLDVRANDKWMFWNPGVYLHQTTLTKQPISLFFQPKELIEAYYDAPKRTISDVKVIFLGHGDVGKTHTIQRILHDDAMETPEVPYTTGTTHGIIITEHTPKDCGNLHIHFWDFGGQHIMNSMHRCFLTERTCYVVVVSTRLPDPTEQARYFLRNIRSFAPDAPVILFVNQFVEGSNEGLDYPGLCQEFPKNIVGKVECSAKNAPIPIFHQLSECIVQQAGKLDSAGMEFPEQWDNVRRELLQMKNRQNYVDLEEYYRICQRYPLVQGEQDTEHYKEICNWLLEWFHDLGVCFNYYRDGEDGQTEHLSQYKVLNPEWLTNAIYIILFRGRAYAEQGVLKRSALEDMLEYVPLNYARDAQRLIDGLTTEGALKQISYSPEECGYVLEVMRKFRLSYPVSQEKEFIPVLCPNQTPRGIRPAQSVQHVRYELEYLYLPDSVVHRLMIRYYYLLNMNQCWQKGMRMEIPMMELVAVVDMSSGKPVLRIDVYAQTDVHETWELLAPMLKDIRDINAEMNLQDVKEFVVMEQGEKTKSYDIEEDILIPKEEGDTYIRWGRTTYKIDDILHLIYGEKNCYRQAKQPEEDGMQERKEESFQQELQRRSQESSPIVIQNHGTIYLAEMSSDSIQGLSRQLEGHTSALQANTSALQENTKAVQENTSVQEQMRKVLTQLEQTVSPDLAEAFATKLAELLAQQQDENLKALAQMIQQEPAEKKGRFARLKSLFEGTDTALSILANGVTLVTTLFPLVQQALTALGPEAASVLQSVRIYLQQVR